MNTLTGKSLIVTTADSPQWRELLEEAQHDIYHIPEYLKCEAERTGLPCEVIIVREGPALFGAAYLLRPIDPCLAGDQNNCELWDAYQSWGYTGVLVNKAGMANDGFVESAIRKMRQSFCERGIISAFFRMHPILNTGVCKKLGNEGV